MPSPIQLGCSTQIARNTNTGHSTLTTTKMTPTEVEIGVAIIASVSLLLHLRNWSKTRRSQRRQNTIDFLNACRESFSAGKDYARKFVLEEKRKRTDQIEQALEGALPTSYDRVRLTSTRFIDMSQINLSKQEIIQTYQQAHPALRDRAIPDASEEDNKLSNFLNLLEEIANGVNTRIFDFQILNKMYGGLFLSSYTRLAFFIRRCRRQIGKGKSFRLYDQLEILVDRLLEYQGAAFTTYTPRTMARLFFLGPRFWPLMLRRFNTYDALVAELAKRDLLDRASEIANSAIHDDVFFLIVPGERAKKKRTFDGLVNLYKEVYASTNGVWPIFDRGNSNHNESVKEWVTSRLVDADCMILALQRRLFRRSAIIGAVGLRSLNRASDADHAHWNSDILSAIEDFSVDLSDQAEFLHGFGVPISQTNINGSAKKWIVDPDRLTILHALAVSPEWKGRHVGRRLFRHAISYAHLKMQKTVLLNVIADEPAMESAIALYDSEGGDFIGSHQDWGRLEFHRMYMYIF